MTEAEKRLWRELRELGLSRRFRRQHPIGRYIVDFVCFEQNLIIELDGGQHADKTDRDERRTAWLESQGFILLRFWNNDVIDNMDGVLHRIAEALERQAAVARTPHPGPLPQGEREI